MLKDWLIFSSAFNNIDLRKYRFSILLIIIIFFTWLFLYQAKDLPYDDNVGSIFISFLISLMTTLFFGLPISYLNTVEYRIDS